MQLSDMHCVKSIRIRSFFGLYFPTFELNTKNIPHLSVFSPNVGKYGSEKLRIKALSRQRFFFSLFFFLSEFSFTYTLESQNCRGMGRHFFNSSLPLPPASQILTHQPGITAESSPLHIANSRTRTANFWFPSASREPLSTK